MELIHHQAQPEDLVLGLSFLKEAAEAIKAKGLEQWNIWLDPVPEKIQWVEEGFKNHEFYFVKNADGQRIGMYRLSRIDLLYWGELNDNAAYVHSLVVRKGFAGKDLGKTIIKDIQNCLVSEGTFLLRLDCNAGNAWLCAYYEQQGFVKVGQKQTHSLNNLYEKHL